MPAAHLITVHATLAVAGSRPWLCNPPGCANRHSQTATQVLRTTSNKLPLWCPALPALPSKQLALSQSSYCTTRQQPQRTACLHCPLRNLHSPQVQASRRAAWRRCECRSRGRKQGCQRRFVEPPQGYVSNASKQHCKQRSAAHTNRAEHAREQRVCMPPQNHSGTGRGYSSRQLWHKLQQARRACLSNPAGLDARQQAGSSRSAVAGA